MSKKTNIPKIVVNPQGVLVSNLLETGAKNLGVRDNPRAKLRLAVQKLPVLEQDALESVGYVSMTSDDIRATSVVQVTSTATGPDVVHGINSRLMGVVDPVSACDTCHLLHRDCQGHYGHIELGQKIPHPELFRNALYIASIVCPLCSHLGFAVKDEGRIRSIRKIINDLGLSNLSELQRLKAINTYLKNVDVCPRSSLPDHDKNYDGYDIHQIVDMVGIQPLEFRKYNVNPKNLETKDTVAYKCKGGGATGKLTPDQLYNILSRIPPKELQLLGIPANVADYMVIDCVRVPPPRFRRQLLTGTRESPITALYIALLNTVTIAINKGRDRGSTLDSKGKSVYSCVCEIMIKSSSINNNQPGNSAVEQLGGKKGQIRGNMTGKRGDFAGRTVLSPATSAVELGEVGMPKFFVNELRILEVITEHNVGYYQQLINRGEIRSYKLKGDNFEDFRSSRPCRPSTIISPGDAIFRCMTHDDYTLENRQPSLGRQSFMAHHPSIHNDETQSLGLHQSDCYPYHADFDGDEGTTAMVQSPLAIAESRELLSVDGGSVFLTPASKNVYGLIGSFALAASLCSELIVDVEVVKRCINRRKYPHRDYDQLLIDTQLLGVPPNSGAFIISSLFPPGFEYDRDGVLITNGVLVLGVLNAKHLAPGSGNTVIHNIFHSHGTENMRIFVTDATRVFAYFNNEFSGLSVGLGDCIPGESFRKLENQAYWYSAAKAEHILQSKDVDEEKREALLTPIIDDYTNICIHATENFLRENPTGGYNRIVRFAGSKGNVPGVKNMFISCGQQYSNGKWRTGLPRPGSGGRSLPFFDPQTNDLRAGGLVRGNCVMGIRLADIVSMEIVARIAAIGTTNHLPEIGYYLRRFVRTMESVSVTNTGSITNTHGNVISQVYEDGYTPEMLILDGSQTSVMDLQRFCAQYLNRLRIYKLDQAQAEAQGMQRVHYADDAKELEVNFKPLPRMNTFPRTTKFERTRIIAAIHEQLNKYAARNTENEDEEQQGIPIPANIGSLVNNCQIARKIYDDYPELYEAAVLRKNADGTVLRTLRTDLVAEKFSR